MADQWKTENCLYMHIAHACTCGDFEALDGVGEVTSDDHGDAGPDRQSGEVAARHGPHKAGEMEDA